MTVRLCVLESCAICTCLSKRGERAAAFERCKRSGGLALKRDGRSYRLYKRQVCCLIRGQSLEISLRYGRGKPLGMSRLISL